MQKPWRMHANLNRYVLLVVSTNCYVTSDNLLYKPVLLQTCKSVVLHIYVQANKAEKKDAHSGLWHESDAQHATTRDLQNHFDIKDTQLPALALDVGMAHKS